MAGGTCYWHCDLLPVEDDHGKIQKLVKFFQEKKWVSNVFKVCMEIWKSGKAWKPEDKVCRAGKDFENEIM